MVKQVTLNGIWQNPQKWSRTTSYEFLGIGILRLVAGFLSSVPTDVATTLISMM